MFCDNLNFAKDNDKVYVNTGSCNIGILHYLLFENAGSCNAEKVDFRNT